MRKGLSYPARAVAFTSGNAPRNLLVYGRTLNAHSKLSMSLSTSSASLVRHFAARCKNLWTRCGWAGLLRARWLSDFWCPIQLNRGHCHAIPARAEMYRSFVTATPG
ncbi:Uncharacterised protein [Mycobacteroides abscessus subsp. abscessus]|nr:Uncharacterised protein [Mycobacteroides abscessus subsp. abscessus]